MTVADPDAVVEGLLVDGLSDAEAARLDWYQEGFGLKPTLVDVQAPGGLIRASADIRSGESAGEGDWDPSAWVETWGGVVTEAAHEVMALYGRRPAREVFGRYRHILVRAASTLRARPGGPVTLRRRMAPRDLEVDHWSQPYAGFFSVEERELRFRRFDGSMSARVNRAVFVSGDAATILPYDPVRDRVLLIEQFRPGPHARGDSQPWLLEPIAGRVDPDETPEETARREAVEEAGIEIGELISVANYYPTPGAKSEYLYTFIGLADLPDASGGAITGVADENEDIRTHLVSFDRLMDLVATGEAENGPLLLSALFLARLRDRLRPAA